MTAAIPVFVSAPTVLAPAQQKVYRYVESRLRSERLEPRALGRSDYGIEAPLHEVLYMARHCAGGVILGFTQVLAERAVSKPGTPNEREVSALKVPTPWNHLEAGIMVSLGLPILVFAEEGIEGGIFDRGTQNVFVHRLPDEVGLSSAQGAIRSVIQLWVAKVRENYRS